MATFESSLKPRLIYIFAINDEWHKDCLKIGETTLDEDNGDFLAPNCEVLQKAARKRIDQYTKTAGIAYQLLYTEMTIFVKGGMISSFNDKQVHSVLERSGINKKVFDAVKGANEWFCCDLETAIKAIKAVKNGQTSLRPGDVSTSHTPIVFRPEQQKAINDTIAQYQRGNKMLWNAKMRFGKTLSALQVVKEKEFTRTLILTHRPVVDEGWFEDYQKIFYDKPEYYYGSRNKGEQFSVLEKLANQGKKYIYFASMQDLRGSGLVGGKFDKNLDIFKASWDFLIVDEAHEGTKTELGNNVISELVKENTKILQLSGTPFNLFDDYSEGEIFTWDYVMEQRAKTEWDLLHMGDPNPYESLPAINIYTYDLGRLMSEYVEDEKAFNFREFFRTREDGTFIHDADIDRFLNLLCKDDEDSLYPYSNEEYRKIFRHTLWMVPGVNAALSLSAKLRRHSVFGNFEIVNVAGNGDEDEENTEALKMVNEKIGPDPDKTYTITLSCGRLTTGVSVKPWTGVFMMAGSFSTSAANYMQTIFRVQTPFIHKGRMKQQCYAFDFAPDRTLRVLAESAKVSAKAGKATDEDRKILGDFLNFCPIISIEGSVMKPYDVNKMMSQLKKAQIEKVVQCGFEDGALYNDELLKLTEVDLKEFENLKGIIGKTKSMGKTGDIDVNKQGFTNEEYEEKEKLERKNKRDLTDEEKERLEELKKKNTQRKDAISILRGISIRMPLLIYGAELNDEEEEITIDNFASLIDPQSWEEFMPKDVSKQVFNRFKKYYEPDVFREASKRIREMARAADKFTIEERIERIAAIFNTFRNPDKETVLTPWDVVNRHMSDCLGGYCFYDEEFKTPIHIPRYIDKGNVSTDVFRPESHILEINSKSGLYPLYVAYSVYRARVESAKAKYGEVNHAFAMSLWDATIEENIFVICKTPMAKSITKRTLVGFRGTRVNARYFKNLVENITEQPNMVVKTILNGKSFWKINDISNMKLDAVIGNPPYQLVSNSNNQNRNPPVYHKFVQLGISLSPNYLSLITPAKWYSSNILMGNFSYEFLSDKRIEYLHDFTNANKIFPTVEIKSGVCYFLWNKRYNGKCNIDSNINGKIEHSKRYLLSEYDNIFIRYNLALPIIEKVKNRNEMLSSIISPQNPFGFNTAIKGDNNETSTTIDIYSKGLVKKYIERNSVGLHKEWIDKFKVITPKAAEDGILPGKVIGALSIIPPGTCCNGTYIVVGPFENELICQNAISYLKTKFCRFLVGMKKMTQDIKDQTFSLVPLQDFTKPWTDEELYAKYGLTEEEIAFIESMIKPME